MATAVAGDDDGLPPPPRPPPRPPPVDEDLPRDERRLVGVVVVEVDIAAAND